MKRLIATLAIALLTACGGGGGSEEPQRPQKIVFIGDSVMFMYGDIHRKEFPGSINMGVNGQTTEQIAARMPYAITEKPDVIVIDGGINDFGWGNYSPEHQKRAALAAKAAGSRVIIVGIYMPLDWSADYAPRMVAWNNEMQTFSVANGIDYINNYPVAPSDLGPDRVHPNDAWYAVLTSKIKRLL